MHVTRNLSLFSHNIVNHPETLEHTVSIQWLLRKPVRFCRDLCHRSNRTLLKTDLPYYHRIRIIIYVQTRLERITCLTEELTVIRQLEYLQVLQLRWHHSKQVRRLPHSLGAHQVTSLIRVTDRIVTEMSTKRQCIMTPLEKMSIRSFRQCLFQICLWFHGRLVWSEMTVLAQQGQKSRIKITRIGLVEQTKIDYFCRFHLCIALTFHLLSTVIPQTTMVPMNWQTFVWIF